MSLGRGHGFFPFDGAMKRSFRRFYREAAARPGETGYRVELDGRPIRTPAKSILELPSRSLAEAIAEEWASQGDTVRPHTMPLMRLAATAIDRVRTARERVIDEILSYAETDLLCYRATGPAELVRRQDAAWQPVLDWVAGRFGARFAVTRGIVPVPQEPAALETLRDHVGSQDEFALAALHGLTVACGSVLLALAVSCGRLGAEEAFAASQIDEIYQCEIWGDEETARERRREIETEVIAAARFLALLQGG